MIAQNRAFQHSLQALTHPVTVGAVLLLLINDHILRVAWPSWWTGKLGDAAWLAFFPLITALVFSIIIPRQLAHHERITVWAAFVFTAILFVAPKTIPLANDALAAVMDGLLGPRTPIRLDPTDLLVLPALGIGWWVWQRTSVLQHPDYSRHGLIICALGALATVATSPPAPRGINCFMIQDDGAIEAIVYRYRTYVTTNGGLSWELLPESVRFAADDQVCKGPGEEQDSWTLADPNDENVMYRFTRGRSIERSSDGGNHWVEELDISQSEAQRQYYQSRSLYEPDGPLDAIWDSKTGNLIVAMSYEGIVVRTPNGQWQWVSTDDKYFQLRRAPQNLAAAGLLTFEIILAVALGFLSISITQALLGRLSSMIIAVVVLSGLVWAACIFIVPSFVGFFVRSEGLQAILAIPVLLVSIGPTTFVALRRNILRPNEINFTVFVATAILTPILFLLPFVLWTYDVIPHYETARIIALSLTLIALAASAFLVTPNRATSESPSAEVSSDKPDK